MVHPAIKQTWVVTGVVLNLMSYGLLFSYPYSLLPALMAPESPIKVDLGTATWIASCAIISATFGKFISSYLMNEIGRRNSFALMMIPGIAGWIIVYFATSVTALMIGRLVSGLWASTVMIQGSVVIGEYTTPEYRGVFFGLKTAALCFGNLFMHIISRFYDWRTIALINVIPLIMIFCNICTWPESPSWLAIKGKYEKSEKDFYWLRGKDSKSELEFQRLVQVQRESAFIRNRKLTASDNLIIFFKKFRRADFVKPLLIIFFSVALLEACGRHTFPAYAYDIVHRIVGDTDNIQYSKFFFIIVIDIVTTISVSISCILTSYLRRRTLLFFSGISSVILLAIICIYCFLLSNGIISERPWIPIALLIVYYSLTNFGCTTIPVTLLGEIMPLQHRGIGLATSGLFLMVPYFTFMKATPVLLNIIDISGTFAVNGLSMIVTLIYLYFALPETRNKTLQEVEEYFNNGSYLDHELTKVGDEEESRVMLKE